MGKSPKGQSTPNQKQLKIKKDKKSKNSKNYFEQAKGSTYDSSQIKNVAEKDKQKTQRIRAVIQIVQHSIQIFKRICDKYDRQHPTQKPIILKLVQSQQQKKYLQEIMWKFEKLIIWDNRKKDIYNILYAYGQEIQIRVKRIFRQILYEMYYQYYEQIWHKFKINKQKSKTQQNMRLLKQYLSFEITDFREQSEQKQQQMRKRIRTKIRDEQPQKQYDQRISMVKLFIDKLMDKKVQTSLMNGNVFMQEENKSQNISNEQQFGSEIMQQYNQFGISGFFDEDVFIEKKNEQ